MAEFRNFRTAGGFNVESCLIGLKNDRRGYPIGFFNIGSTLYRVTTSPSMKNGVVQWVKITKCRNSANRR